MSEEAVLEKAKSQGYNPDYTGDDAKTPEQFIADGEKIAGVVSKQNKILTEKIESLELGMKESFNRQGKMFAEVEKRGYDKAVADIERKQDIAEEEADVPAFKALEKEKQNLKKPKEAAPVKTDTGQEIHPDFKEWAPKNKWYKATNPDAASLFAVAIQDEMFRNKTELRGAELFDEVKRKVAEHFPDILGKKAPNNLDYSDHSVNEGSSNSELPPEAAKQFKADVKQHKLSKEEQVTWKKQYWGES